MTVSNSRKLAMLTGVTLGTICFFVFGGFFFGGRVEAQNPVRGVIRPVPGSKPLAIQTPTVGLASPANAMSSTASVGVGHSQRRNNFQHHNGHYHGSPLYGRHRYNNDYYARALYGYGYGYPGGYVGGYPYYPPVIGVASSGVGLTVGSNGGINASFYRGVYSPFYGGYIPASYGRYRYGYSPYGYGVTVPVYGRTFGLYRPTSLDPGFGAPLDPVGPLDAKVLGREPIELTDRDLTALERAYRPTRVRSSLSEMQKSLRLLSRGDQQFKQGDYVEAKISYRAAIRAARELPEAYMHLGFAEIADGSYRSATSTFQQAFGIDPAFWGRGFRLDSMYPDGASGETCQQHLDALAQESLADTDRAELHFLLGVMLHFRGESDRATKFLATAAEKDEAFAPLVAPLFKPEEAPIILRGEAEVDVDANSSADDNGKRDDQ